MDYYEALDHFFSSLPMFSTHGKKALKPKLDNIRNLVSALEINVDRIRYVHVAGTNGKGSTCHIISAALQHAGYKVGLLTSPHLVDLRERVKINGEMASKELVIEFVEKIEKMKTDMKPSYFEMNVALAFYVFTQLEVDVAVLETGLGGRWDSTNIVTPEVSVITSIDYDHIDILGDTLEKIAYEKAGIIKSGIPVVIGKKHEETTPVFTQSALSQNAPIFFSEDFFIPLSIGEMPKNSYQYQYKYFFEIKNQNKHFLQTDLLGEFQWENIRTAWAAVRILNGLGWRVEDGHFVSAIKEIKKYTQLRGRWDVYAPNIILDVGHNPEGIQAAIKNLSFINKKYKILYGSVKDKDVEKCVSYLPENAEYYITHARIPRAMPVDDLEKIFINRGIEKYLKFENVEAAIDQAITDMDDESILLIIGSFFIVGEAYVHLDSNYKKY